MKHFPKTFDYGQCERGGKVDEECYQEGVSQEMNQWTNLYWFLIANILVFNYGSYLSILAWALSVVVYYFPALATTESNKINPKNPTFRGIPSKTIYNSVEKIKRNPFNPVILFFEVYSLVLDLCHSLAYLLDYAEQYVTLEQGSFPTVSYAGRNGIDLSNDLNLLANSLSIWQMVGGPGAAITIVLAPAAALLYSEHVVDVLGGGV